jgi:hypothetical protein
MGRIGSRCRVDCTSFKCDGVSRLCCVAPHCRNGRPHCCGTECPVGKIVSLAAAAVPRPLVQFLHLWHWPFAWFGNLIWPDLHTLGQCALLAGSLVVATLSYTLVENPVRYHPRLVESAKLSLAMGAILVGISFAAAPAAAWWVYTYQAIVLHDGKAVAMQKSTDDLPAIVVNGCHIDPAASRGVNGHPALIRGCQSVDFAVDADRPRRSACGRSW